jgi:hypothetical protein
MTKAQTLRLATAILAALSATSGSAIAADTGAIGEPGRESGKPNQLKNLYFGEQHLHTRNSFDAFTIGVNMTWDDAYRYAKGEEIKLSTTGEPIKKRTPLFDRGQETAPTSEHDPGRGQVSYHMWRLL